MAILGGQGLAGFLTLVLWLGATPATAPTGETIATPPPPNARLSVLTYNINWGNWGRDRSVAAIEHAQADLVVLQETNPEWERYLRPRLRKQYPHALFRHAPWAGGFAVFSKWPVRQVRYTHPKAGLFPAWLLEAQTPLGKMHILAVHLRPPFDDHGQVTANALLSNGVVHRQEMEAIFPAEPHRAPALVLGDFNEHDEGVAMQWLAARGFRSALPQFDKTTITWQWRVGDVLLQNRYDHIMAAPSLRCFGAKVIKEGSSDHYPVLAVFGPAPTTQPAAAAR